MNLHDFKMLLDLREDEVDILAQPDEMSNAIIRMVKRRGTHFLGFEANDAAFSPSDTKIKRIKSFLHWLFDFEQAMLEREFDNMPLIRELGERYLYERFTPREYQKIYRDFPKTSVVVKFDKKITKHMKVFIKDNYDKIRVADKAILFNEKSDSHLFLLTFSGQGHTFHKIDLEKFSKPIDEIIQNYWNEWKQQRCLIEKKI